MQASSAIRGAFSGNWALTFDRRREMGPSLGATKPTAEPQKERPSRPKSSVGSAEGTPLVSVRSVDLDQSKVSVDPPEDRVDHRKALRVEWMKSCPEIESNLRPAKIEQLYRDHVCVQLGWCRDAGFRRPESTQEPPGPPILVMPLDLGWTKPVDVIGGVVGHPLSTWPDRTDPGGGPADAREGASERDAERVERAPTGVPTSSR